MSYEARFGVPHNPKPPYQESESHLYDYTREVVEKTIRGAPGLDAIGFRIGESGHGGEFFRCYLDAVAKSGREIPLLTRSWITRKANVVPLARGSGNFTVEIKYNGEQWGPLSDRRRAGPRMEQLFVRGLSERFADPRPGDPNETDVARESHR